MVHHGSRQLAATEIQGGQCGAVLKHTSQVLEGVLEVGLQQPGGRLASGTAVGAPSPPLLPPRPSLT